MENQIKGMPVLYPFAWPAVKVTEHLYSADVLWPATAQPMHPSNPRDPIADQAEDDEAEDLWDNVPI
ncbi:MAG: hypothetical protein AAF566_08670 [Pseudomonadota bacterium]